MLLKIYGSIGVSGGGALDTQFQIRTVTTFVYDITRLRGAASTADVCMNFQFQTFNSGSAIIYLWTNTTNAVAREYAIDVLGFSIPNGDTN